MIDQELNEIAATAHICPNFWNQPDEMLPEEGFDWGISNAQKLYREKVTPNCLVGTAMNVLPKWKNYGLSDLCGHYILELTRKNNFKAFYLPIRPVTKVKHQKMGIEEYVALKDDKGQIFDYWMRAHVAAGAKFIKTAARSEYVTGTVAEWESCLPGEKFPMSGEYLVTDRKFSMVAPLVIDVEKDIGIYVDPGIWLKYDV